MDFNDTLYHAIKDDGRSLRQLAKEADCDAASLSRFCGGFGILSSKIINKLLPVLGLELTQNETTESKKQEAQ